MKSMFALEIKIKKMLGISPMFIPLIFWKRWELWKHVSILYQDNLINNIKQSSRLTEKWTIHIKHSFWHIWAHWFFRVLVIDKKKLKLFIKPSNEHSYHVGGNCPSGFRREEKIENRKHPFWHLWAFCFFCVLHHFIQYDKICVHLK